MAIEYRIDYAGRLREGFAADRVRQSLEQDMGLDPAKVDIILSGGPRLLVKSENRSLMQSQLEKLRQCGLEVSLRETDAPPAQAEAAASGDPGEVPPPPPGSSLDDRPQDPPTGPRQYPFEFQGSGGEYFRIWITNLLLSIITLGLYSPWAKVRRKAYFYGNTILDQSAFEYTASPKAILKGRIIAVVCIILYNFSPEISPYLYWAISAFMVLAFPWVVVRSLKFNARNSMYRNIRFGFDGTYWKAMLCYLILPAVSALPVALAAVWAYFFLDNHGPDEFKVLLREAWWVGPLAFLLLLNILFWLVYAYYRQQRFIVEYSRYGTENFRFTAGSLSYFLAALGGAVIFVLGAAVMAAFSYWLLYGWEQPITVSDSSRIFLLAVGLIMVYLASYAFFSARALHIRYNYSTVAGQDLSAVITAPSYIWLVLSNTMATTITLGLFSPWANVRTHRYLMNRLSLHTPAGLGRFAAGQQEKVGALGEEFADIWDFDIGF